jgi:hypothetical protein
MSRERKIFNYKVIQFSLLWAKDIRYAHRYKLMKIDADMQCWHQRLNSQELNYKELNSNKSEQLRLF